MQKNTNVRIFLRKINVITLVKREIPHSWLPPEVDQVHIGLRGFRHLSCFCLLPLGCNNGRTSHSPESNEVTRSESSNRIEILSLLQAASVMPACKPSDKTSLGSNARTCVRACMPGGLVCDMYGFRRGFT